MPAPPFNPADYWATRKWVEDLVGQSTAAMLVRSFPGERPAADDGRGATVKAIWDFVDSRPRERIGIADVDGLVAALASKEPSVPGKHLSTEDYTTAEKAKLSGVAAGANATPPPVDPAAAASAGSYADAKLARDLVNKSVSDHSAHYLTHDAGGSVFPSAAALRGASVLYYAGEPFEPTNNDWAIVREDEEHPEGGVLPSSRWIYVKPPGSGSGGWQFNVSYRAQFTTAQLAALDSGAARGRFPVRPLPKYLHLLSFDDTYMDDARAWYAAHDRLPASGGCSAVRSGGLLGRNYDWTYDETAEFVVKVSAKEGRHASVGVANVGAGLAEDVVCSGVFSPLLRVLPGVTLDGVNDAGVAAEVNVIPRDAAKDPEYEEGVRDLHPFEVVRRVLDGFGSAADAAEYVAARYYIPEGSADSYHWTVADAEGTYVVEDGRAVRVTGEAVVTNHRLFSDDPYGSGYARKAYIEQTLGLGGTVADALEAARYTNAYAAGWPWPDEFAGAEDAQGRIPYNEDGRLRAWATARVTPILDPATRRPSARGNGCWQTVHSSIYDFAAKTLSVCVQEDFSKRYTFAVGRTGAAKVEGETLVLGT